MAYLPRYEIIWNGATFHVTWQCHNHSWLMKFEWAKKLYYELLLKYKDRYRVIFYSYCFMNNHPHLTGKIEGTKEEFSALFRTVNSLLARKLNKSLKRKGQVVMDRFKSPCIQTDRHLLQVMVYLDLNPCRAKIVDDPREYRWSSYRYYAYGEEDPLLTLSPSYLGLGGTSMQRQQAYRRMVQAILEERGYAKATYSKAYYIGDPDWVRDRYQQLSAYRKTRWLLYLMRQQYICHPQGP